MFLQSQLVQNGRWQVPAEAAHGCCRSYQPLSTQSMHAEVNNNAVPYSNSTYVPVAPLCLPFEQSGAIWIAKTTPSAPGCVPPTEEGVTQNYAPRKCPYALPAGTTPTANPEYMVRVLKGVCSACLAGISTILAHSHCAFCQIMMQLHGKTASMTRR